MPSIVTIDGIGSPSEFAKDAACIEPHNVRPLSGRGGARATPDLQAGIPPPRSAPAAGYDDGRCIWELNP